MTSIKGLLSTALVAALIAALPSTAFGARVAPSVLDILTRTDGAQAVVAAALVVDEAGVLDFSLAELLGDRRSEVILLAPSNAAFENLLGLEEGTLNGLTIDEVKDALPGLLPSGVGAEEVAAILLKHVSLPRRVRLSNASAGALLAAGFIEVADGSRYPVGIGSDGVTIDYEINVIRTNMFARNGVVHFIDTVIVDDLL